MRTRLSLWTLRLFLAALLGFASEIIVWSSIQEYALQDWLLHLLGYLLLSTIILDIVQRYRLRDGFDAMIVFAGAALFHSLLINPLAAWQDFPASLITYVLGAQALIQSIVWGIFLALLRGDLRKYAPYQIVAMLRLGIFWGVWMRWTPELRGSFVAVPLSHMVAYAGTFFGIALMFYALSTYIARDDTAADLRLSARAWAVVLLIVIALYLYQSLSGAIEAEAFAVVVVLLTLCWLVFWFRREEVATTLLEQHLPLKAEFPIWIVLGFVLFVGVTQFTYDLPLIKAAFVNQLWLMDFITFVVGLLWLPIVAIVLAFRAFDRLMREGFTF